MLTICLKQGIRTAIFCLLVCFLSACSTFGPSLLPKDRYNFNGSVQDSDEQQLILNLVRLKYREPINFLEISSITSQNSLNFSGSASPSFSRSNQRGSPSPSYSESQGYSLSGSYSTNPTVSYSLMQGTRFTTTLLTPYTLDSIYLFLRSGWEVDRVLRIMVQTLNRKANGSSSSAPSDAAAPQNYETFIEATKKLRALQLKDALHFGYERNGEHEFIIMEIEPSYNHSADAMEFRRLLDIHNMNNKLIIEQYSVKGNKADIIIGTRSLLGTLYFLSDAVQVPEREQKKGAVAITRYPDGTLFNWDKIVGDLLKIYSYGSMPNEDRQAILYRNNWYFIKDNDLKSKATLSILSELFQLTAGGQPSSSSPLLTLPAGGF